MFGTINILLRLELVVTVLLTADSHFASYFIITVYSE